MSTSALRAHAPGRGSWARAITTVAPPHRRPVTRCLLRYFDFFLRRFGTFAPARRASERPMAMACLRLLTFLPERPLLSVPFLRLCMAV